MKPAKNTVREMPHGKGIFSHTKRITFWLSNFCNLAGQHKPCPLSRVKNISVLPERVILDVLRVAAKYDYKGMVSFHLYNEPTLDPRLVWFMEKTKEFLPQCKIMFISNGTALTRDLLQELADHGLDELLISVYSKVDRERFVREDITNVSIPVTLVGGGLDKRLTLYARNPTKVKIPCWAPLYEIIVTCDARVGLCCFDWDMQHTFGSLLNESLETIITSEAMQQVYKNLTSCNRVLDLCTKCKAFRGGP
jgi:MoaA/NifB/PqqE/SkfB family radical SAM enzyme